MIRKSLKIEYANQLGIILKGFDPKVLFYPKINSRNTLCVELVEISLIPVENNICRCFFLFSPFMYYRVSNSKASVY